MRERFANNRGSPLVARLESFAGIWLEDRRRARRSVGCFRNAERRGCALLAVRRI